MKTIVDYAQLVKQQHALNISLAPVEADSTASSKAYAIGQHFILDGELYKAKTAIALGDALVLDTNYEAAGSIEAQIETLDAENQALVNNLNNEVTTRAALGAHNLFGVGNSLDEWFAAVNDGKLPTSYLASETITGTVDKDTNSIVITAYNNTGYRWGCKKINLKKNTSYTFSRTSCDGTIQLFGKNNADDRAVVISGLSNGGTVNSGDYDWWYVGFYPTRSGGYFSITDLLVKLETDADTTFQPYAKSNQELTAENQTLTNKLDDEVETRAKVSAHNLFNIFNPRDDSDTVVSTVTANETSSELAITSTIGTYKETLIKYIKLPNNTDVILTFDALYTSGQGRVNIDAYDAQGQRTALTNSGIFTENYSGSVRFNTANYEHFTIRFYVTLNVDTAGSITYRNVMICLASDPSTAYAPYAMTNKELTDIKSIPITLNSDYFDNNATAQCFKLGRLVWLQVSGTTIAQIPSGNIYLTTSNNIPNAKVDAGIIGFAWNPTSGILGQLRISSHAINFPFNTAVPSGTQFKITLMYMTEE